MKQIITILIGLFFITNSFSQTIVDTDGDGIPDNKDACPTVKGVAKYQGCPVPDSDGDGVNDEEDKCPLTPGVASNYGCPLETNKTTTQKAQEVNTYTPRINLGNKILKFDCQDFSEFVSYTQVHSLDKKEVGWKEKEKKQKFQLNLFPYGEYFNIGNNLFWLKSPIRSNLKTYENENNRKKDYSSGAYIYDLGSKKYGIIKLYNYNFEKKKTKGTIRVPLTKFAEKGIIYWLQEKTKYLTKYEKLDNIDYDQIKYYEDNYWEDEDDYSITDHDITVSNCKPIGSYEINTNNKIYTYRLKGGTSTEAILNEGHYKFDYDEKGSIISVQKMEAVHNKEGFILIAKDEKKKLLSIDKLLSNAYTQINNGYGQFDNRDTYDWYLKSITSISNKNYLIKINVEGSFKRYLPHSKDGFSFDVKRDFPLTITIDENFNTISVSQVEESNNTIYSHNNLFYEVFNNSMEVICYDEFLKMKWFKKFGNEEEGLKEDMNFVKFDNGNLYIMGSSKNMKHVGIAEPVVFKVNANNGQLISKYSVTSDKVDANITGYFKRDNKLYVILDNCKIVYACDLN